MAKVGVEAVGVGVVDQGEGAGASSSSAEAEVVAAEDVSISLPNIWPFDWEIIIK